MNNIIHFTGHIETVQPYASATPSLASSVRSGQPTPVTRIFSHGEQFLSINSATIKGTLRRSAADIAFLYEQEKTKSDKPLSLKAHKLNRTGGSKGKGESDRLSPADYDTINNEHLIVGLFGAGDPFVAGRLSVNHAIAKHNSPIVIDGVRSDDFLRDPNMLAILDEANITEFLENTADVSEASKLKKQRKSVLSSMLNASTPLEKDQQKKLLDALDKKLEKFKSVSTQMPLPGFEAIPGGDILDHSMRLEVTDGNLIQLGFLLEAMEYFAFNPVIGGKKANGCGEIKMSYTVSSSGYKLPLSEIGKVTLIPYVGLEVSGELLQAALEQYRSAKANKVFNFAEII
ncbi:hypothetical protein GCM10011607_12640 [Shewanella inventionis]|uniref:Uncharacterized protein n=1 Tax=Shewanella inventionis TaxID=1738770 RepID=A0ABQ1IZJ9_9GAMM|nr:hypothetical protein [Shewanella inventionis]GGB53556.1 hypothetical protein GCM10011607_12640 [Shewanella inventionis]